MNRLLLLGLLVLAAPLAASAQSGIGGDTNGLAAIFGKVRDVEASERVVFVDRHRIHVPEAVMGFDSLERGQRVVVRLDPSSSTWTATSIEILP